MRDRTSAVLELHMSDNGVNQDLRDCKRLFRTLGILGIIGIDPFSLAFSPNRVDNTGTSHPELTVRLNFTFQSSFPVEVSVATHILPDHHRPQSR